MKFYSHSYSLSRSNVAVLSSYDAVTSAYMTAIGIANDSTVYFTGTPQQITGAGIWNAVDAFVLGLKTDSIFTLINNSSCALWPMIGGTATRHKYNLLNPINTDAGFRLTFFSGVTHDSLGIYGAASGYAKTKYIPSVQWADINSNSIGLYMQTDKTGSSAQVSMGCFATGLGYTCLYFANPTTMFPSLSDANGVSATISGSKGLLQLSRTSGSSKILADNDSQQTVTESTTSLENVELYLLALNNNGSPSVAIDTVCSGAYAFNVSLNSTQLQKFKDRFQTLQTALGRAV